MRSNLTARKGIIETQIRELDAKMEEKRQRAASGKDKEQPDVRR
jgi:hypothetical protein